MPPPRLHQCVSRSLCTSYFVRIAHLATDVPIQELVANPEAFISPSPSPSPTPDSEANLQTLPGAGTQTYVICRLGNDSQIAADALRSTNACRGGVVKDLIGGLRAWTRDVDPRFPVY